MHLVVWGSSLWDDSGPPPPGSLHLPVPADVIPGRGHVLHGSPTPTAHVWGPGGLAGRLPPAHEATGLGLLDMADHAVTETQHRWRHGVRLKTFLEVIVNRSLHTPLQTPVAVWGRLIYYIHSEMVMRLTAHRARIGRIVTCGFHACMYI